MIPETPSRTTIGKRTRERPTARSLSAGIAERGDDERREDDEERGQRAEAEQQEPEEGRGDPPRALAVALLEQLAEDGNEGGGERGVGDERAEEVRHLEGDREGVDLAGGAEVVRRDDLADEAEDAREPGGEREDRRRPGESPAGGPLLHAGEYRNGARRDRSLRDGSPWSALVPETSSPLRAYRGNPRAWVPAS